MTFAELRLIDPLLRAVRTEGYTEPTPIQQQAIPHILDGRDLLGCAQTGTGKTAAFALPILQRLSAAVPPPTPRHVRALVLSPTRELASQIAESFATYGRNLGLHHAVIFGGVGQEPQVRALRRGIDILVATPGRLLDLMGQRLVHFPKLDVLVLDEADRMLDMGFLPDVRRILAALPTDRQTLLLSATMPSDIRELASRILRDPVHVAVVPPATTAERIDQSVYFVEKNDKRALLEHLLDDPSIERVLVFTRTKHGANRVAQQLCRARIGAEAIHGNKAQGARERALANFRSGATRVLVATDIAARGIDVDGISHVINFDLPNVAESYVHRIGRTARAGAAGVALSFCDLEERAYLADVQRLIRMQIPVVSDHPYRSEHGSNAPALDARGAGPGGGRGPSRGGDRGRGGGDRGRGGERGRGDNRSAGGRERPPGAGGGQGRGPRDSRGDSRGNGGGQSEPRHNVGSPPDSGAVRSGPQNPVGGAAMIELIRKLGGQGGATGRSSGQRRR